MKVWDVSTMKAHYFSLVQPKVRGPFMMAWHSLAPLIYFPRLFLVTFDRYLFVPKYRGCNVQRVSPLHNPERIIASGSRYDAPFKLACISAHGM
jgi:hypothetical protein